MSKRPRYYVFEYEPDADGGEQLAWISHEVYDIDKLQALHAELVKESGKPAALFDLVGPLE